MTNINVVSNCTEVPVGIYFWVSRISTSIVFKNGYDDYMNKKPFNYDINDPNYSRGRHYAAWSVATKNSKSLWKNGKMSKAAQQRLLMAARSGCFV